MIGRALVLHGAILVLVALGGGLPLAFAILRDGGDEPVRAWRVAHAGGVTVGIALIALGAAVPQLRLGGLACAWRWSMIVAAYSFVLGATLAASSGVRGLAPSGSAPNQLVFAAYVVGTIAAFIGTILTICAARGPGVARVGSDDR